MSLKIQSFETFLYRLLNNKPLYSSITEGHEVRVFSRKILMESSMERIIELYHGRCWYFNSAFIDACESQIQGHKDAIKALELKIKEAKKEG